MHEAVDAPEFHTENTLSPLSPSPKYLPEAEHIPVLQNQTDPYCNMSTAQIDKLHAGVAGDVTASTPPTQASIYNETANSSPDSSFSDAYKEEPPVTNEMENKELGLQAADSSSEDDYGMAIDTDEEQEKEADNIAPLKHTSNIVPTASVNAFFPPHSPSHSTKELAHESLEPSKIADSSAATHHPQSIPPTNQPPTYIGIERSHDDIQALLDKITSDAEQTDVSKNDTSFSANPTNQSQSFLPPKPTSGFPLPPHSSLPPRPQVPAVGFAGYGSRDEMLKQHSSHSTPSQSSQNPYRPGVSVPYSLTTAGAPGTTSGRGDLPPPPGSASLTNGAVSSLMSQLPPPPGIPLDKLRNATASFSGPYTESAAYPDLRGFPPGERPSSAVSSTHSAADSKWPPEVQRKYDAFLEEERKFIADQSWNSFPTGSRLFIGNLNGASVTKRDIFHYFHVYGRISQISVKQSYGFVQFHEAESCREAVRLEQGTIIRGNAIQLQVSKSNKTKTGRTAADNAPRRRSRSPENRRALNDRTNRRESGGRGPKQDEYGRPLSRSLKQDSYRPTRSPSPDRGHFRGRGEYGSRSGDHYDGRDRRRDRSRSRSPYHDRYDGSGYRNRSSSPRRDGHPSRNERELSENRREEDPLRRRDPSVVPDIQIFLTCPLDPDYVSWIETELRKKGLKTDVMTFNPRLPEEYLIKRQVLDGVHAVSKLGQINQSTGLMSVKVFNRKGHDEVLFDEYTDLTPSVVADVIVRAKEEAHKLTAYGGVPPNPYYPPPEASNISATQQLMPNFYGLDSYKSSTTPAQPAAPPQDLGRLLNNLGNEDLQKLLGTLAAQAQQQAAPAVANNSSIDIASILQGLTHLPQQATQSYQQQSPSYPPLQQQQQAPYHSPPDRSAQYQPPQQQTPQYQQQAPQQQYATQQYAASNHTPYSPLTAAAPSTTGYGMGQPANALNPNSVQNVQNIMATLSRIRPQ